MKYRIAIDFIKNKLAPCTTMPYYEGLCKREDEVVNEKTREVQRMDELMQQVQNGEFTPSGSNDILNRALNKKEHLGRTRGVINHIGNRIAFDAFSCGGSSSVNIESII